VLGSSGTGKTILGLHFLAAGLAKREPALYFGFFESPPRLLIILVRQIEIASELKRAIAVMKTRDTSHDSMLRELHITDRGLEIGEPFPAQGAVLTGGGISEAARLHLPFSRSRLNSRS
jgi:KaiC/GvpD/RAD55 family RecA-like ATPase